MFKHSSSNLSTLRSSNYLDTCDPNIRPITSCISDPFTPRRALDSSGRIGSFYDAGYDRIRPERTMQYRKHSIISQRAPSCYVTSLNSQDSRNLLEWYKIHEELRLSIALQLTYELGVANMINYSHPIDQYTRFISYNYYSSTEYISDNEFTWFRQYKQPMLDIRATHVIVLINWGVCAVAMLQLPAQPENIARIDNALDNLCVSLENDRIKLSDKDEQLLRNIGHTEVFSSIPRLNKIRSVIDFHREISRVKYDRNLHTPFNYNLCSIHTLFTLSNDRGRIFIPLQLQQINKLEDHLLFLSSSMKRFIALMNQKYQYVKRYLNEHYREINQKRSDLKNMHKVEIRRLGDLIIAIRRDVTESRLIDEILNDDKHRKLIQHIHDFEYDLTNIQEKETLIQALICKRFEYRNAKSYGIQSFDDLEAVKLKVVKDEAADRFIFFNDHLVKNMRSNWNDLVTKMVQEYSKNTSLRIIFVDFTYCIYELQKLIAIGRAKMSTVTTESSTINTLSPPPPLPTTITKAQSLPTETLPIIERSTVDDTINILLLGESGVGKSTFINALANYLAFDTLHEAQEKPFVLMPVSFLITVGDNFEEKQATFDEQDDLNDEDYSQPGQSVTQHCKSYVFTLKESDNKRRKLRIIDTPGIGDVRGIDQDDINMQHILLYISNLSHLNGICILMKPNNSKLNIFFRSCFMQLFDLLGKNAAERIIFCFTNSRSTFYTPGDSGPLIKQLIASLSIQNIPYNKTNTFCFDSESFRYLVAKRNKIEFNKFEEEEYQDSWKKSSIESRRLLRYIWTTLISSIPTDQSRSRKYMQLQITILVRPILETIRNILRNIVLCHTGSGTTSIGLHPNKIHNASAICLKCSREPHQYGNIWIIDDLIHVFHSQCRSCYCSPNDHYRIDYQLTYRLNHKRSNQSSENMQKTVDNMCYTSVELSHFLRSLSDTSKNDLFVAGIERMIKDEHHICKMKPSCSENKHLLKYLQELKEKYEIERQRLHDRQESIDLLKIYRKIDEISRDPMINAQIGAAKKWHKFMIKHYEDEVLT